jgi:hypothetical protein
MSSLSLFKDDISTAYDMLYPPLVCADDVNGLGENKSRPIIEAL